MRVPTLQQQGVQSVNPYNSTEPLLTEANQSTARTIESIAGAVNSAGTVIGAGVEQRRKEEEAALAKAAAAQKQAQEVQIADGLVNVQRKVGDRESKFLGLQGLDAVRDSGPALDDVDKAVQDEGERYTDPQQKALFDVKAKAAILATRKSIEGHTTREYAAGVKDTFNNLRTTAIANAGSIDLSPEEMKTALAPVDQAADEFMPAEQAKAAKLELRADVSDATIQRHLDTGKLDQAAAQLELDRGLLGAKRAANLDKAIDEKKKAATKDAEAFSATAFVARTAADARNQYGFLEEGDENKLRDEVGKLTPEKQKVMDPLLERAINTEGERRVATVKSWTNEAKTKRLQGGTQAIGAELMDRLEKYNPDYVASIREDDQKHWDRLEAKRAGGAKAKAADKAQAALNKLALTRMQALPYAKQATFEDDVGFDALGLDEQGKANLAKQQQLARNLNDKGFDRAKEALDNDVAAAATAKALKGELPGTQFEIKADANDELQNFLQKNQRAPDAAERAKIVSDVTLKQKTKPRFLDSLRGPGEEFPFQAKKRAGAAGTAITSYAYSPDKKQRRPRYSDGTLGPIEQVQ